jgi:serine/threonine protein kinase
MYERDLGSMPTKQNAPAAWKQGDVIGSGAFGSVHVALNVDTGELIAVKSVPIFPSSDPEHAKRMRDLQTEIGLMGKLNHPNIVCYLGTDSDKQNFNILMEFVPGGSIASMLKNFGIFDEIVVSLCVVFAVGRSRSISFARVLACVRACVREPALTVHHTHAPAHTKNARTRT